MCVCVCLVMTAAGQKIFECLADYDRDDDFNVRHNALTDAHAWSAVGAKIFNTLSMSTKKSSSYRSVAMGCPGRMRRTAGQQQAEHGEIRCTVVLRGIC